MEYNYEEKTITQRHIESKPFPENDKYEYIIDIKNITKNEIITKEANIFLCQKGRNDNIEEMNPVDTKIFVEDTYNQNMQICMILNSQYQDVLHGIKHITEIVEPYDYDTYDKNEYTLVLWNWASHDIRTLDGEYIVLPITISYMQGVTEKTYDLNDLIAKIKNGKFQYNVLHNSIFDKETELKIRNIPYYNASENEREHINCQIIPDLETYTEMKKMEFDFEKVRYMLKKLYGIEQLPEKEYDDNEMEY